MDDASKIQRHIDRGEYVCAYESILSGFDEAPKSAAFLSLSCELSRALRSECMRLASNKATDGSLSAGELEALLRAVIRLNGEGIYG
jgi:hypothetical protein